MGDILGKLLDRDARLGLPHILLAENELVEGDVAPGVERDFLNGLCHAVSP
ncbi:hypothetical protein PDO_4817 [Rhizobium sp. PDO1-076]|nr:hypothetical protein PDO_4817 [Rhizobium sp. PDO1-076]